MKLKDGGVLLLFAYVIREVTPKPSDRIYDLFQNLNLSNNKNPLVVVIKKKLGNTKDSRNFDDFDVPSYEDNDIFHDEETKEEAKQMLYNYLLRTGAPQNTEEATEDNKRFALRQALRARCQAKVECEKKCEKSDEDNKDKYCPVNCKAVFDQLNLCDPPKDKEDKCKKGSCEEEDKCKEKDNCGKRGRTMPPKWRF